MSILESPVNSTSQGPASTPARYRSWQEAFKDALRDPAELCELLRLPAKYLPGAMRAARQFPLFAPREYVARMRCGDPADPLLRQILPIEEEQEAVPGFDRDPVGDRGSTLSPGLLHKYHSRVLLITTGACAVHC